LKLYVLPSLYRQGDFAKVGIYENDVTTLIYEYKSDISCLLKVLTDYLDTNDIKKIKDILAEINARMSKFKKK
jgi:hypothetical protein